MMLMRITILVNIMIDDEGNNVYDDNDNDKDKDSDDQAGTNCCKLASGLRGPTEFLRTSPRFSVFTPQSSVLNSRSSVLIFPGP